MKTSSPTITCIIAGQPAASLRAVQEVARGESDLDKVSEDVYRSYLNGVETITSREYHLGDYFTEVEIIGADDTSSFKLVFHVREGVSSFWKDALDGVLRSVESTGGKIKSILRS